jgi:hypothetical protein
MVSDRDRRELYVALLDRPGRGPADTMMQTLPPVRWADVARTSDLEALPNELRGETAELRGEMAALRSELKVELRPEAASLRTQLFAANVVTAAAVAGLVLAAAKLA